MKKIILIIFILLLAGCGQRFGNNKIYNHEFIVGGERVIVGGEQKLGATTPSLDDFKPEVILEKWGDETYIKVWTDDPVEETATQIGDKIISLSLDGKREYNFYPTIYDGVEAFEYEVILLEKPDTNVISLKIETKDLVFHYQDELTQQEIDEGASMADDVIGSYAVYHVTKQGDYSAVGGKNYKTGKAYHIYRPQMEDAKGWKVWGELNIDKNVLTVTIPQDFINKAVYPIKHATGLTFGDDSCGATFLATVFQYGPYTSEFTATAGTVNKISICISNDDTTRKWKTGVYTGDGSTPTGDVLATSSEIQIAASQEYVNSWLTENYIVSAQDYWLGFDTSEDNANNGIWGDDAGGHHSYDTTAYGDGWPTWGETGGGARSYSIYATYNCAAGTCTDVFDSGGTHEWTAPTGITSVNVACWGGSGGGADGSGSDTGGGGGGAGAYAVSTGISVTAGNKYFVVVGVGGNGAIYSAGVATGGTDSSFDSTVVVADGGGAGNSDGTAGVGGTIANSTGDTEYAGGDGGTGASVNSGGGGGGGGAGGPDGAGDNGNNASGETSGTGGDGDAGSGGAGGAITVAGGDSVKGGGGGGGAGVGASSGGSGGFYGGGGGGGQEINNGGAGSVGACTITYTFGGAAVAPAARRRTLFFD